MIRSRDNRRHCPPRAIRRRGWRRVRRSTLLLAATLGTTLLGVSQQPLRTTVSTGGRVVDLGTGQRIAGATVTMIRRPYAGVPGALHRWLPKQEPLRTTSVTDPDGVFRFRLPVGSTARFFAQSGDRMSLVSRGVAGGFAKLVLHPTRDVFGRFRRGNDNRPLAALTVRVCVPEKNLPAHLADVMPFVTETDTLGRYRCRVPLGTWVRIEARRQQWQLQHFVHEKNECNFVSDTPPTITGRVLDLAGRPVADALVVLSSNPDTRGRTDAGGQFRLYCGKVPSAYVHVFAPECHAVSAGFGAKTPRTIKLPGSNAVKLTLVDAAGDPLAATRVVALSIAAAIDKRREFQVAGLHRTDSRGRLTIRVRRHCGYLTLLAEVGGQFVTFFRGAPGKPTDLGRRTIVAPCTLSGQVRGIYTVPVHGEVALVRMPDDKSNLLPAASARIDRFRPEMTTALGSGGRFVFPNLQPGRYLLTGRPPNSFPFSREVEIDADGAFLRIELSKGRTVRGRITDQNGNAVAGAAMTLLVPHPILRGMRHTDLGKWLTRGVEMQVSLRADADGRYEFFGAPPCELHLGASHPRGQARFQRAYPSSDRPVNMKFIRR